MITNERAEAETLFYQGAARMQAGDDADAEACFRKAIEIAPDFPEAYANLGLLLERRHDKEGAENCYQRSLQMNPAYPETYLNLGALLASDKRFDQAEAAYRRAIALSPASPAGWSNLGVLYACMKREIDAEECYRVAMSLDETYATARFNLSYLLLRQGRFEEGWCCLEARNWYSTLAAHLACPRWQGEPLAGKSILIGCEAGHGDMIQFCRYVAVLKAQGAASISMICHPALVTLLSNLEGLDNIISLNDPITSSGWDYWTPLLSVPNYCKTRLDSIPSKVPYLAVSPQAAENWAGLLPNTGLRVGLVWKGSAQFENDADRSLPSLDTLAPLASVANVHFVSLQKGAGEDEALQPPDGMALTHVGSQLVAFADTAAVVANLDLVICVDSAVAHLAGALGKPCWVLLPDYKTDWRWLTERADSPWYPTMRLFRQTATGDWSTVINDVAAALQRWK